MSNATKFLLERNVVVVPPSITRDVVSPQILGTVFSNLMHYGYIPSESLYKTLAGSSKAAIVAFWDELKPALEDVTGASRKMDKHIVYKNFPQEVLDMSEGEYWVKQILMYWGLPNELFTEDEVERDDLLEDTELTVLQAGDDKSLQIHYDQLMALPAQWTDAQRGYACDLLDEGVTLDLSKIPFKDNLVLVAVEAVKRGASFATRSATDVLRLGVALSDGDYTLVENSKFVSFSRPTRRFLLGLLNNASNLEEDMARDLGRWKKFMVALRPGDYKRQFPNVTAAYDSLYKGDVHSFNSRVEARIARKDEDALVLLSQRPGDFARRLQSLIPIYGRKAVKSFAAVAPKLKVVQLLKLRRHFATIADREFRTYAPRGNWNKMQVAANTVTVKPGLFRSIIKTLDDAIRDKIMTKVPSVKIDPRVEHVTIQGNDSDLAPYGRNTRFMIPDNVTFIRTASYWQFPTGGYGNIWYDNGFNFFDKDWKPVSTCCWNANPDGGLKYAAFSGDPTNSKTLDGKACQMIDLYLDKAEKAGVRYAVWNILCYSHRPFSDAQEVYAALQWGEKPQRGKTFEPSRCQLSFPVGGKNMTKYIAIIDVVDRVVIYMDANLKGAVNSAASNASHLATVMPAYMEYLETQPTILDIFKDVPRSEDGVPVLYDDVGVEITTDTAYVFKPLNEENEFAQLDLSELLGL